LGNLVLTLDNARYSNKEYTDKRGVADAPSDVACYYNGSLEQERQLARDFQTWGPEDLRRRQATLTQWIVGCWPLPQPETTTLNEREIDEDTVADEVIALRTPDEEEGQ
jgi:hypothetical protein